MNYLNYFIINIDKFLNELNFSPLVLIGLLITSLSLILTLKDTNIYIAKFKKQNNIIFFINRIYRTAVALIFLFLISFVNKFLDIDIIATSYIHSIIYFIVSFLVIILVLVIIWNLLLITYTIKKIVTTSLKQ